MTSANTETVRPQLPQNSEESISKQKQTNHKEALCGQNKLASIRKDQEAWEAETQNQKGNILRYQRPKKKKDLPLQVSSSTDSISCLVSQSPRRPSSTIFHQLRHLLRGISSNTFRLQTRTDIKKKKFSKTTQSKMMEWNCYLL